MLTCTCGSSVSVRPAGLGLTGTEGDIEEVWFLTGALVADSSYGPGLDEPRKALPQTPAQVWDNIYITLLDFTVVKNVTIPEVYTHSLYNMYI